MKPSLVALGVFVLVLSPLACSKQEGLRGTATVTGKVLMEDNPLPFGAVQFYDAELVYSSLIQSDGSYKLENLPEGPVKICIRTRGELYASSRDEDQQKKRMVAVMKDKVPQGMTAEEAKERLMTIGMKGKRPGSAGFAKMMGKGPGDEMPMVNGTPLFKVVKGMPAEALARFGQIHDKYGEYSKSPLTYIVLAGAQNHDIILK
jgi:hypothetical protein